MTARPYHVSPLRLYGKYLSIHLRSIMEYRLSFLFTLLGQIVLSFSMFLTVYFLFARFHTVEGFTYSEVLLCFSVVLSAFSLAEIFFRGLDTFPTIISNGEFDRMLVRPRSEVFQVVAAKFELSRAGRLVQAVVVSCYAIPGSGVAWTPGKIFLLALMVCCGALLFACLFWVYATLTFFTTQGLEFMNILTDGGREFGSYPLSIYGRGVLRFLTYVVPMACYVYYPFLYLIGHSDNPLYAFLPLCTVPFALPCCLLWRFGMRCYKSTGS